MSTKVTAEDGRSVNSSDDDVYIWSPHSLLHHPLIISMTHHSVRPTDKLNANGFYGPVTILLLFFLGNNLSGAGRKRNGE